MACFRLVQKVFTHTVRQNFLDQPKTCHFSPGKLKIKFIYQVLFDNTYPDRVGVVKENLIDKFYFQFAIL